MLTSIYKDYVQKSRVFLYPVLGIQRGNSIVPIETYVSWEDQISVLNMKLICLYHHRTDDEFKKFEENKLINNKLFSNKFEVEDEDEKSVYTFDLSSIGKDYDCFITGKYSRMSFEHKRRIREFYGHKSANYDYVDSYLSPEKYYKTYAKLLGQPVSLLREVGELCSPPNLEKETLFANIKNNLQIPDKSINT